MSVYLPVRNLNQFSSSQTPKIPELKSELTYARISAVNAFNAQNYSQKDVVCLKHGSKNAGSIFYGELTPQQIDYKNWLKSLKTGDIVCYQWEYWMAMEGKPNIDFKRTWVSGVDDHWIYVNDNRDNSFRYPREQFGDFTSRFSRDTGECAYINTDNTNKNKVLV